MDIIIVFLLILGIYQLQIGLIINRVNNTIDFNKRFFNSLFFIHLLFFLLYLAYSRVNRSDSGMYYARAEVVTNWFELFNSGTTFIDFLTYPFVRFLHLSFYSVMLIFSFLGFQGLLLFYLTAKENISNLPVKFAGFTILEILFLLPNAHFWSASIGKGSIMVMGIGMFFYGLSRFNRRYLYIIIGCFFIYMVRKHILVGILVGVVFGIFFGNLKVNVFVKLIIAVVCGFVFLTLYQSLALETGIDFDLNEGGNESVEHLATELAKSNSGVDIQNYNQALKLFTFLFRPLFFDAPNFIGIFSSIEDLFCLILTIHFLLWYFFNFRKLNGFYLILLVSFCITAISLAQISGNLGIAVRQKAQIMPLFFLVYSKFLTVVKK